MSSTHKSSLQVFVDRLHGRSPLSVEEKDALLGLRGHSMLARAHVDIVSPGDIADHACLVVEGLVGWFGLVIDGKRQITALHVAGDMCDLHSVVAPTVSWALQALSPTAVLRIPHRELREVAVAYPNVAEAFWRDCSVDASVLSQWVVNVGRRQAASRMAHLFCEMALRMESAGLGTRQAFRLHATQTQLGDALGLTPVHVNRTLRTLKELKLVGMNGFEVRIADWDRLAELGDFDEGYLYIAMPEPMALAS